MKKTIVNNHYKIQKQPTKGGWHYLVIKGISASEKSKSGLIRISGTVDNYKLKQFKYYIDWIEESKKMEIKISRISKTIAQLEKKIKFYDWPAKE